MTAVTVKVPQIFVQDLRPGSTTLTDELTRTIPYISTEDLFCTQFLKGQQNSLMKRLEPSQTVDCQNSGSVRTLPKHEVKVIDSLELGLDVARFLHWYQVGGTALSDCALGQLNLGACVCVNRAREKNHVLEGACLRSCEWQRTDQRSTGTPRTVFIKIWDIFLLCGPKRYAPTTHTQCACVWNSGSVDLVHISHLINLHSSSVLCAIHHCGWYRTIWISIMWMFRCYLQSFFVKRCTSSTPGRTVTLSVCAYWWKEKTKTTKWSEEFENPSRAEMNVMSHNFWWTVAKLNVRSLKTEMEAKKKRLASLILRKFRCFLNENLVPAAGRGHQAASFPQLLSLVLPVLCGEKRSLQFNNSLHAKV